MSQQQGGPADCRQPLSQNSSTSHARLSLEASPLLRFEPPLGLEDAVAECPGTLPESEPLCTLLHPTQPIPQIQCHRLQIGNSIINVGAQRKAVIETQVLLLCSELPFGLRMLPSTADALS